LINAALRNVKDSSGTMAEETKRIGAALLPKETMGAQ
jgi:hypothetical protein